MKNQYPHVKIQKPSRVLDFIPTGSGGGSFKWPARERVLHGDHLKQQINAAWVSNDDRGIYLEFISSPDYELCIKSLENLRPRKLEHKIRLCHVKKVLDSETDHEIVYATVFVPIAQKDYFLKKIKEYSNPERDKNGKPKNQKLVDSINNIRKGLVESFWLNKKDIPDTKAMWCEVWIRHDNNNSESKLNQFVQVLNNLKIKNKPETLIFPERAIKLIKVDGCQLTQLINQSDCIAEFRKANETAAFFLNENPSEQSLWTENLLQRIQTNFDTNIAICILDTGINYGHPLIAPFLSDQDCLTVKPEWQSHDHDGHGSLMAGLAIFGDLQDKLENNQSVIINHQIESVKLLPLPNQSDSPAELWGDFTQQAISKAEINEPKRTRIICMAVSAINPDGLGLPSSWSAAIDQISAGLENNKVETQRLVLVAAGNSVLYGELFDLANYPEFQKEASIHDPAQAWNALSIGAYTNLIDLKDNALAGYIPLAQSGQLSPFSCTSRRWDNPWPIKPEIVFEGGNIAINHDENFATECDDLQLISTYYKPHEKTFNSFSMTSAATAQAANFAAQIQCEYPDYWPETIRALIVHSAEWTPAMKEQFAQNNNKGELYKILRACGYGVPNLERALYCANNHLTLIVESEIQPFKKEGKVKANKMHLYELPWPKEALEGLGSIEVEMRVTLSYFIEPSAGEIGWKDRYVYPSYGLRFALNSPTESIHEFTNRINKVGRDETEEQSDTVSPSDYWRLGSKQRDKGSIHSDTWRGTASDLASSNLIGIYPVSGWWKNRPHLDKWDSNTRYSLIVSIHTDSLVQSIDIYSTVVALIKQEIEIV